eukprot:1180953-Prorocentrum_minimum.AAC.5
MVFTFTVILDTVMLDGSWTQPVFMQAMFGCVQINKRLLDSLDERKQKKAPGRYGRSKPFVDDADIQVPWQVCRS